MNPTTAYFASLHNSRLMLLAFLLFLLMPICGILFCTVLAMNDRSADKRLLTVLFLFLSLYMGAINATKVPYSDQVQYMNAYLLVPHQSFLESLTNIYGNKFSTTYKEMGFGLLNFVGYYLSLGNYQLFVVEYSVLLYMLMMVSVRKFIDYMGVRPQLPFVVSAVFSLCFYSQYFNLTIHLQRQMIATAVMLWALVDSTVKQKPNWIVAIIAVTLHTSTGLFLPFLFLMQVKKRLQSWHIFALLALFCIGMGSLALLSSQLASALGFSFYALDRLAGAGSSEEGRFNVNLVIMFSAPLIFIALRELWKQRSSIKDNINLVFIAYVFLFLFAFLNPDNTMQYRFFMMSYSFLPFILPLLFKKSTAVGRGYLFAVAAFFTMRFYLTFDDMPWQYAPVEDVLLRNYIWFLLY